MDELVTPAQAHLLIGIVAAVLFLGSISAVMVARPKMHATFGTRGTLALIVAGPLIYLLWHLDALLIRVLGFDTILRLGVELVLFAALGLIIGIWIRGQAPPVASD